MTLAATPNPLRGRRPLALAAALLVVAVAAGCAKREPAARSEDGSGQAHLAFRKITIRGWSASNLEWELSADRIEVGPDRGITMVKGLRRAALMHQGKAEVEVSARQARVDNRTRDLTLSGGVTLRTAAGLEVKTRALRWIARKDQLQSEGPARMRLGQARLDTPLAIYDAAAKRLICPHGIRVVSPNSTLSAHRLVAEIETRELRLSGDVRMSMSVQDFEAALAGEGGRRSPLQQLTPLLISTGERHG